MAKICSRSKWLQYGQWQGEPLAYFEQLEIEPVSGKRYMVACAPIEDSDQSVHARSLIRVFDRSSMGSQGSNVSSGEM